MSEWKEGTLRDFIELGNGKARPKVTGTIPVYGGNGILGYCNDYNYSGETIVIGRVGAYCGTTYYANTDIWVSDNALSVKPKKNNNAKFLYYCLLNMDLNQFAEGSSHPLLTHTLLYALPAEMPNEFEQQAIAGVLGSLDDKIDLLHRQNVTLEKMAETLFRQWFIEEAGEDWEEVKIGEVADINGQSIGKKYNIQTIQYLDTGSLTNGKISEYQIFQLEDAPSRAQRLVKHNDILISMVRPNQCHYGIIKNPEENVVVSTGFCVISCKKIDPHFLYIFLTSGEMTEYLHSVAEGSTSAYPALRPTDIANLSFKMPPQEKLQNFVQYATPAWEKITRNQTQITTLERLRDTLLPKLMSGEVRVQC